MALDFFQPLSLQNLKGVSVNVNFSNNDPSKLLTLFEESAVLGSKITYAAADYPNASPSTFGCWFPVVENQTELTSNFMRIGVSASNSSFFFFKANTDDVICLHRAATLADGYASATQVFAPELAPITTTNIGVTSLYVLEDDGPVIIVGVIDIGLPESK